MAWNSALLNSNGFHWHQQKLRKPDTDTIQAIHLCTGLKISLGVKYIKLQVFQPGDGNKYPEVSLEGHNTKRWWEPSLQQRLCMRSKVARPTNDTYAHLRVSKLFLITTSIGKPKWIFWVTTISNTTKSLKEISQAVKLQLLLTSKHLHWHPLWLSSSPFSSCSIHMSTATNAAKSLKISGLNMALKCLNMVCEPHCKYLFNAQDNQLALPETEKKKQKQNPQTNQ